jgi:hypothetical protein
VIHQLRLAVWRVPWSLEARMPDPIWRWRCVHCGQMFSQLPSEDAACPAPPGQEMTR